MFSKIRSFAERHHRKFLFVGAVIGGGVFLKQFAERKLLEWQEREMNQILDRSRKQQHFESTEKTCNLTIASVVPQLQMALSKTLDSDSITILLKNKAPNKKDLWEQLKIISFSRIMCYIYSNTMLVVLMRAQVNVLGAYLYLANQNPSNPDLELSPELQSQFLSASNFYLSSGIEQFCLMVEKVVSSQVKCISLKDCLTLAELEHTLHDIYIAIENELHEQSVNLASFMFPPLESSTSVVGKMMSETREVLESREVSDLVSECVKMGLSCVLDKLAENVLFAVTDSTSEDFVHPNRVSVYVAKLIPVFDKFIYHDVWSELLLKTHPLNTFGANIYESFSTKQSLT